jgi:hypothetical protein
MVSSDVQINDQHMRGKRMAKGMTAEPFADAGFLHRRFDGLLKAGLQRMVPLGGDAAGVATQIPPRKNILPGKLTGRGRIISRQGRRQIHFLVPVFKIFRMKILHLFQVQPQVRLNRLRQNVCPFLAPFCLTHEKHLVVKVHILDPQTDAFHEPQAKSVMDFDHQQMRSRQAGHDTQDLALGHDGGGEGVPLFPNRLKRFLNILVEHMAVQKEDGVQGLPLGCGRDFATGCQMA